MGDNVPDVDRPLETPAPSGRAAPAGVPPKPWGLTAILAVLAVPLLLWAGSLALVATQDPGTDFTQAEVVANLLFAIVVLDGIFIGGPALVALWRYHLGWQGLGLRPFDRDLWWLPLAAAAAAYVGIIVYAVVLVALGAEGAVPEQEEVDQLFEHRAVLPLAFLATVIMAPLAEEIFFRGFVFAGLVRPLGVAPAMLASGLLFGAFHVTDVDTVGLVVPFGFIGALFAWLYYRTGSLWPSVLTHLLFNLVSFIRLALTAGGGS
jgi:membrane protease YdiL (CAAX protease family)